MLRKDLAELNKVTIRKKIGNLYYNLDTSKRRSVLFGLIFFVQRCLIVVLLAVSYDFGLQWQLFQVVILLNTAYLIT